MDDVSTPGLSADLVLEGGGVKGVGLVGAIDALEKSGYQFERVAGTSAGAIVGAFAAAGCNAQKLAELIGMLDYTQLRDETFLSRFGLLGKMASLGVHNGLYKGDYLRDQVAAELKKCGVTTFADLRLDQEKTRHLPKEQAYKLVVVTADVSKGELVYLPWDYHKYGLDPDTQNVADAVRASMSIPFFYIPSRLQKSTLIDGGMFSNFPIGIFDRTPDWPTLGIKLSSQEEATIVPRNISGPINLARALFSTLSSAHDHRHLDNPSTIARTIFVDTGTIEVTNFDITKEEQAFLFASGQKFAHKFLKDWDFNNYKKMFPNN
jgi:NTE family protein